MTKRTVDESPRSEADAAASAAGPTRLRRGKQAKATTRTRKTRRKASIPGGIHLRSNKRIAW